MALDLLKESSQFESDFERHVRIKNEQNEKHLAALAEIADEKRRRERNDPTRPLEDIIKTEVWDVIDQETKRQREDLNHFFDKNATCDPDGHKFMQYLEKSKVQFGPYALKVAEDFVRKMRLAQEKSKTAGKRGAQEKISFVKMEYFLRGVVEADLIID